MTRKPLAGKGPRPRSWPIAWAQARLDYAEDRGVAHAVVREWLLTWGGRDRRSFAEWLNHPVTGRRYPQPVKRAHQRRRRVTPVGLPMPLTRKHRPSSSPRA